MSGLPSGQSLSLTAGVTARLKELQSGASPTAAKQPEEIICFKSFCTPLSKRFSLGWWAKSKHKTQTLYFLLKARATPAAPEYKSRIPRRLKLTGPRHLFPSGPKNWAAGHCWSSARLSSERKGSASFSITREGRDRPGEPPRTPEPPNPGCSDAASLAGGATRLSKDETTAWLALFLKSCGALVFKSSLLSGSCLSSLIKFFSSETGGETEETLLHSSAALLAADVSFFGSPTRDLACRAASNFCCSSNLANLSDFWTSLSRVRCRFTASLPRGTPQGKGNPATSKGS